MDCPVKVSDVNINFVSENSKNSASDLAIGIWYHLITIKATDKERYA